MNSRHIGIVNHVPEHQPKQTAPGVIFGEGGIISVFQVIIHHTSLNMMPVRRRNVDAFGVGEEACGGFSGTFLCRRSQDFLAKIGGKIPFFGVLRCHGNLINQGQCFVDEAVFDQQTYPAFAGRNTVRQFVNRQSLIGEFLPFQKSTNAANQFLIPRKGDFG